MVLLHGNHSSEDQPTNSFSTLGNFSGADGVLIGASDFQFLVGAMILSAGSAVALLLAAEPMGLGLEGVWGALAVLMAGRLATLAFRYQSPTGPLPPLNAETEAAELEAAKEMQEGLGVWAQLEVVATCEAAGASVCCAAGYGLHHRFDNILGCWGWRTALSIREIC